MRRSKSWSERWEERQFQEQKERELTADMSDLVRYSSIGGSWSGLTVSYLGGHWKFIVVLCLLLVLMSYLIAFALMGGTG